jgi:hypothetical protein
MPEILFYLFWLAVFLVIWAVIGHGLWLMAAAALKAIFAEPETTPQRTCPNCGRKSLIAGRCTYCHQVPLLSSSPFQRSDPAPTDRQATRRYLQSLLERGQINPEQHQHLLSLLQLKQASALTYVTAPGEEQPPDVVDAEIVYFDQPAPAALPQSAPTVVAAPQPPQPAIFNPQFPPQSTIHNQQSAISPPRPSRSLAEMLQAFLEEKNIRWGEILAGLFIVISAVGLIISLRNTLKAIPYFPALMFMLFTVLFHGAGLYSLKKWNLHAVSRVVLVISLLLVSLSFGAGIVLSGQGDEKRSLTDPWVLVAIVTGLAAFSWVTWSSASELVRGRAWQIFVAVMGAALGQVLINRVPLGPPSGWMLIALSLLPLISFLVPLVAAIAWDAPATQLNRRRAGHLLLLAGVGTFSLIVPLTLLVVAAPNARQALADLAPLFSLVIGGVLAVGLLLQQKIVARSLAVWRTAGTSIAILAIAVLLVLLALAWPRPEVLIATGLIDGIALITLAVLLDFPLLHAGGLAALTIAWLIGSTWLRGALPLEEPVTSRALLLTLSEIPSAVALTVWNAMVLGVALFLRQRVVAGLPTEPQHQTAGLPAASGSVRRPAATFTMYFAAAAGVAALTLLLTANAAFAPWMPANPWPMAASLIFVFYAVAILACTRFEQHWLVPAAAAGVWWVALLHLLSFNEVVRGWLTLQPEFNLLRLPTLAHAISTAVVIVGVPALAGQDRLKAELQRVLSIATLITSMVATAFVFLPWRQAFAMHAWELLTIAATWLLLTGVTRQRIGAAATQLALHAAAAMAVAAVWHDGQLPQWYGQAGHLSAQLAVALALALVWGSLRLVSEHWATLHALLRSPWSAVDEVVLPLATIALLAICAIGLGTPIGLELGLVKSEELTPHTWMTLFAVPSAWLAVALALAGFAIKLWERFSLDALTGIALTLVIIPVLAAGAGHEQLAAATYLRWGLSVFVGVTTAAIIFRESLLKAAAGVSRWRDGLRDMPLTPALSPEYQGEGDTSARRSMLLSSVEVEQLRYLSLLLGAVPIIVLTCIAVGNSLSGAELAGPLPDSLFGQMGLSISYGVPLLAIVGALLIYSVREQESRFALASSLVFQGAVNLAMLLYLKDHKAEFPYLRDIAALSLQVNALGGAAFVLAWLGLDPWITPSVDERSKFPRWLDGAVFFVTRLVIVIALWAVAAIVVSPAWRAPWDARLANYLSFIALALNVVVVVWRYGRRMFWHSVQGALLLVLSFAALVALALDTTQAIPWRGYVVLETSWLAIGLVSTILAWIWITYRPFVFASTDSDRLAITFARRGTIVTALAAALAVYGGWDSPWHPWYALALIVVAQCCLVAQGTLMRTQWVAYLALVLAIATGIVIWGDSQWPQFRQMPQAVFHWLDIVGLTVVVAAATWLVLEAWFQRRRNESLDASKLVPMHHLASALLMLGAATVGALGWLAVAIGPVIGIEPWLLRTEATALVSSVGLLLLAGLWDRRAIAALPLLFIWGIAATFHVVAAIAPPFSWIMLSTLLALATYLGVTAHLWKWGADFAGLGLRLGISDPVAGLVRVSKWLPATVIVLAVPLAIGAVAAVLTLPQRDHRMAAAITPLLLGWAMSSLAQERRTQPMLVAMYLYGALAAICLGCADLPPQYDALMWLVRTIRVLMALSFATLLYGLAVPRFFFVGGDWHFAARRAASITAVGAAVALLFVMGQEVALFVPGAGVEGLTLAQIVAVSVVLALLAIGLFSLALFAARDPLGLSEDDRMYYVYAGEAVAALLFAHLYLVRPHFFDETLRPYWPYIIVALAFASVGLGELFQRNGVRVLGKPLQQTGGLLPLLPALGIWFLASQADNSIVLFAIGLIYLMHCWLRQSTASGLAAALAGNAALWTWLAREEWRSFFHHPQFWLIPPALSVLLAAHLNRKRLEPQVMTAIRYAATLVIYLSSTSEMFIVGIGQSLWPPMVLALLGLAGAFAGMMLQIRAFLYLGAGFVLLALVSMVAHAAQAIDHVWPWWAFGIGVGMAILVFFGVFEKKRAEVMQLVERLRQWS